MKMSHRCHPCPTHVGKTLWIVSSDITRQYNLLENFQIWLSQSFPEKSITIGYQVQNSQPLNIIAINKYYMD